MTDINVSINLNKIGFTINLLIDQLGAVLLMMMVYVIVKYKKLHDSPCLKLIGIFMFCCLCSKFSILLPYLIMVVPLPNVPLWACFIVQVIFCRPGVSGIMPCTTAMGFDRVLSIFFPLWYGMKRKTLYFTVVCVAVAFSPIQMAVSMFATVIVNGANQSNCTSGEIFAIGFGPFPLNWEYLNYLTIAFYAIIVLKLIWDGRDGRQTYFNRQPIFKSFAIIIAIQVIGQYAIKCAYGYVPPLFTASLSSSQMPLVYYGINCFSSLVTTAQFWGIYFTSLEHRNALQKTFPRFFFIVALRRKISPVAMHHNIVVNPPAVAVNNRNNNNNNNNPFGCKIISINRSVHHTK